MSDNESDAEQNSEMLQGSQPNTTQASSDSANIAEGTATSLGKVWSPRDTSVIALGNWPNSNRKQGTRSNNKKWVENIGSVTPELSTGADPLGSVVPVISDSNNAFVDTAVTPSGNPLGKRRTRKPVNPQKDTAPPLLGPSTHGNLLKLRIG